MKILSVASEMSPFASTGGLGDVAGALPLALQKLGVEVVRVLPMYHQVWDAGYPLKDTGVKFDIPVGLNVYSTSVWVADGLKPVTYFIRRDEFFDRTFLYGLPERDYDDNVERFVFFQKAVVSLIDALKLDVDVVHCHDWQTGLIPLFLSYGVDGRGRNHTEKVVYSIHNIIYQGIYPASSFALTNLPISCFSVNSLEFFGKINFMKGGIVGANLLTTVSNVYSRNIQTPEGGCGLDGVIRSRAKNLRPVCIAVDFQNWDPARDSFLKANYSEHDLHGKHRCKEDLITRMDLKIDHKRPIIGVVNHLTSEKGCEILNETVEGIVRQDVGLVVLAVGEGKFQEYCRNWSKRWAGRCAAHMAYDRELAHRIFAGADLILVPSYSEPCCLSQMYGLRYGALPIIYNAGSCDNIVYDLEASEVGNGFIYNEFTAASLLATVKRAVNIYIERHHLWHDAVVRAMKADHSWDSCAPEYLNLYKSLKQE